MFYLLPVLHIKTCFVEYTHVSVSITSFFFNADFLVGLVGACFLVYFNFKSFERTVLCHFISGMFL